MVGSLTLKTFLHLLIASPCSLPGSRALAQVMAVKRSKAGRMLLVAIALVACCSIRGPTSFVSAPSAQEGALQQGRRAALLAAVAVPSAAQAVAPGTPKQAHEWFGSYSDPQHPMCRRMLRFDQTTYGSIIVEGVDGNPGCQKLKGTQPWIIKVDYKSGADTMTFDFSPKGGPSGVVGKWDKDGILFPDGNKWTRVFKMPPPPGTLPPVDPAVATSWYQ
eukprot:TRINITY_DN1240_c0_g1_i1.p1 TRINITY_DN1240_c0_g1~~TRINITY_DN1240_c0_g1_i1.p1  ORF type:complete len:219 (-),score=37.39 TRINITY_DN1240_c0_g1_i1:135-791(-)